MRFLERVPYVSAMLASVLKVDAAVGAGRCGAPCAFRSDEAAAGVLSRAFSGTVCDGLDAAADGDNLDAGVTAREAGLDTPFEVAAWAIEATSSEAGCSCAIVARPAASGCAHQSTGAGGKKRMMGRERSCKRDPGCARDIPLAIAGHT